MIQNTWLMIQLAWPVIQTYCLDFLASDIEYLVSDADFKAIAINSPGIVLTFNMINYNYPDNG